MFISCNIINSPLKTPKWSAAVGQNKLSWSKGFSPKPRTFGSALLRISSVSSSQPKVESEMGEVPDDVLERMKDLVGSVLHLRQPTSDGAELSRRRASMTLLWHIALNMFTERCTILPRGSRFGLWEWLTCTFQMRG
eukprot:4245698-Pyramimonas_sp.AAC.2